MIIVIRGFPLHPEMTPFICLYQKHSLWRIYQNLRGKFLLVGFVLRQLEPYSRSLDEGSATSCIANDGTQSLVGQFVSLDVQSTVNLQHHRLFLDTRAITTVRTRADEVCLLAGIFIMLLWPWIFLATIWAQGGVQMDDHVARVVKDYPQRTSFVITLLGNMVSIIVSAIFSTAVLRFSQEWARNNDHVTVFNLSLISAFRLQNWPWSVKDHKYMLVQKQWLHVGLAGACIAAFAVVPSGTTSLITPVSFNRKWPLVGKELDFSSNVSDCVSWFSAKPNPLIPKAYCSWKVSKLLANASLANHTYLSDFQ